MSHLKEGSTYETRSISHHVNNLLRSHNQSKCDLHRGQKLSIGSREKLSDISFENKFLVAGSLYSYYLLPVLKAVMLQPKTEQIILFLYSTYWGHEKQRNSDTEVKIINYVFLRKRLDWQWCLNNVRLTNGIYLWTHTMYSSDWHIVFHFILFLYLKIVIWLPNDYLHIVFLMVF